MWAKVNMNLLFLLGFLICSALWIGTVQSQGMIAIPNPSDEEDSTKLSSGPSSSSENEKFGGQVDDKEKSEKHKKIAASHIQAKTESSLGGSSVAEDDSGNVARKDKPLDLQNPQKHASDGWLLHFLLEQYSLTETSDANVDEQVDILQNLEHFAHKYENGRDLFQSTNALKRILLPALNSSFPEIRKAACGVFAVAAQNNGIVQKTALQNGVIRRLVHILTFDLASVRSRALYGLASLLRNYPEAQRKFILDGGISALVKAASLSETRKRSMNLVTDLLLERKFCRDGLEDPDSSSNNEHDQEGEEADEDRCDMKELLERSLELNGWCEVLEESLSNVGGFDTENQILITDAVEAGLIICIDKVAPYAHVLHRLLVKFEQDEDFTGGADKQVQAILAKIDPLALSSRDEL